MAGRQSAPPASAGTSTAIASQAGSLSDASPRARIARTRTPDAVAPHVAALTIRLAVAAAPPASVPVLPTAAPVPAPLPAVLRRFAHQRLSRCRWNQTGPSTRLRSAASDGRSRDAGAFSGGARGLTPRVIVEPARLAGLSLLRCQTDERLVDLSRAGNERAFEAIVDRYMRPLLRYCTRLLPPARAEDVVQQAFLNAYAGLHRDDRRIELRPWLYRIAHNAALNALRENGWSHDRLESVLAGTDTTHEAVE